MPTLILMRHCKAVDRLEAGDDFERGLTEKGRNQAEHAAQSLIEAGIKPALALISPALRTLQTWKYVSQTLNTDIAIDSPMALYHASTRMLERAALEPFQTGSDSIIMVGHNPGIGGFVHDLAATLECTSLLPKGWPTSALAVFEIEVRDDQVMPKSLTHIFNPKPQ